MESKPLAQTHHTHNKSGTDKHMCNACIIDKHNESSWEKYLAEVSACDCLTPERKSYIRSALALSEDFSDGVFMAFMEERGIDVSELECFSTTHYAENHAKGGK